MCVYLVSRLAIPVAPINERLGEGLDPTHFYFMRQVRCSDVERNVWDTERSGSPYRWFQGESGEKHPTKNEQGNPVESSYHLI